MDNPEEYLLRVLRRTQTGLQDSLIPYHAGKMQRLTERLEQATNLKDELRRLHGVNGFTRAALSLQWMIERVERSGEDFTPDQFDVDASTLGDKFFEAFLSEPFDGPSEGAPAAQPSAEPLVAEPVVEAIQEQQPSEPAPEVQEPVAEIATVEALPKMPEPELAPAPPPPPPPPVKEAPALTDLLDQNLLLGFQRFTEIVSKLGEKTPSERKSVFAVLAMIAKSSTDVARAQGKKEVLEFFQSVIKFITYVDTSGSAQDSRVAEVMRVVGERLSKALKERSDGPALLLSINEILQNPEGALK